MAIWAKENSQFDVTLREGRLRGLSFNGTILPVVIDLDGDEKFEPSDNMITVKLYAPNIVTKEK